MSGEIQPPQEVEMPVVEPVIEESEPAVEEDNEETIDMEPDDE